MELTIVLSVKSGVEDYDILDTLESLPWDKTGVDLIVYSRDTERIKRVISEGDLEPIIRDSEVGVLFCETPEENLYHTIGLEDTKTDGVMFLEAGDTIEDFQGDILVAEMSEPIGIPGIGQEGTPETITCYECRTLPDSYRGMIFKAQWLRDNGLTQVDLGLTAKVCNLMKEKLGSSNYWGSWSDLDISESLSISRAKSGDEEGIINALQELWNSGKLSYNPYLRDLIWSRMTTSAANIVTSDPGNALNYLVYLYPANKTAVLN